MMKHCVCKKFSCRRGASVLIALLVFFLAALAGTVALTMAASNAGRYTHETDDQQAYLSVASAAKLILSKLEKYEIYFKTKDVEMATATNVTMTCRYNGTAVSDNEMFFADEQFQKNLIALTFPEKDKLDPNYKYDDVRFRLTVDGVPSAGSVYVLLDMLNTTLIFYFWSEEGNIKNYQMTMTVDIYSDQGMYDSQLDSEGNVQFWYRIMKFETKKVRFEVERDKDDSTPTEGEGA